MENYKAIRAIKFKKSQALSSGLIVLALGYPIIDMVKQGLEFGEVEWFGLAIVAVALIYWNIIRMTILMIYGVPAIVITKNDITLTQRNFVIEWKDIEEMNLVVTSGRGKSYTLVIEVKDPWKSIGEIRNPLMRNYCWFAKDYGYKPFSANLSIIEGDCGEVFDMVQNYFHHYRLLN